ncbi:MAG: Methionyl-tRNA formyltransferase [Parcubacteria group bacterium GW2011_GWA2_56_7]|nr:MAG: Methionyl-tRNA formyltransferase [Parcubacteria group bacterium GW2011_GWA2_56_7]
MIKTVFFGSPQLAVPFLNQLVLHDEITVLAVVTQPDKPMGRSGKPHPSPIAAAAELYDIPVLKPERLKKAVVQKELLRFDADVYVVVAYGKILPKDVLTHPPFGTINMHPSLLPHSRGPTPMRSAILHGETETGISIMKMDEEMDHGPILSQLRLDISDPHVDAQSLEETVTYLGPKLLIETLLNYTSGNLTPIPQDDKHASYTHLLSRDSGVIDWANMSALQIDRMVRAYRPWPGVSTVWDNGKNARTLKILRTDLGPNALLRRSGVVFERDGRVFVSTKKGSLELKELQLAGAKPLSAQEFLKGHPTFIGARLGQ